VHTEAFQFVERTVRSLPSRQRVVEFGGLNINGTIRGLFAAEYTSVDQVAGPGVDVVADAATYTHPVQVDTVVCCEVLEHTPDGAAIVANAALLLEPNGVLILTCAANPRLPHSAVDGGGLREGEYYGNVAAEDFNTWLDAAGFEARRVLIHPHGDLHAIAWKATA
jgi:SAM-dependent methyltransferase